MDEAAGANFMSKKNKGVIPVCEVKCPTCPFREGSKTAFLALHLAESALTQSSRICHSTGSNNAFHRRTGKPEMICRGSRDVQIQYFHAIGFIAEPTDEAWAAKLNALPPARSRRDTGDATACATGKS